MPILETDWTNSTSSVIATGVKNMSGESMSPEQHTYKANCYFHYWIKHVGIQKLFFESYTFKIVVF